jgi:hypothetical protein
MRSSLLVTSLLISSQLAWAAAPAERTVAKLAIDAKKGPIEAWITRARDAEGGVVIKIVAKGVAPKAQALTLYTGGGAEDGAGDAEIGNIKAQGFEMPGGAPAVRVDVTYKVPDGRKHDEQTDTYLVGLDGKTRKLLELPTSSLRDRSKTCREGTQTQLQFRAGKDGVVELLASTSRAVDPLLGDDDLPVDKTCKAPSGVTKVLYRMKGDVLVQIDPPPAPAEED